VKTRRSDRIMKDAFHNCSMRLLKKYDVPMRIAAYIVAMIKLAKNLSLSGEAFLSSLLSKVFLSF